MKGCSALAAVQAVLAAAFVVELVAASAAVVAQGLAGLVPEPVVGLAAARWQRILLVEELRGLAASRLQRETALAAAAGKIRGLALGAEERESLVARLVAEQAQPVFSS